MTLTEIVNAIFSSSQDQKYKIFELTVELYKNIGNLNEIPAAEKAEKNIRKIKESIAKKIDSYRKEGITPPFEFGISDNVLIGRSYIRPNDNPFTERFKKKFLCDDSISTAIELMGETPFEYFCKYLLELYGIRKVAVTQRTRDGGIDFIGVYKGPRLNNFKGLLTYIGARVVGQAKHHNNRHSGQGPNEIEKFNSQVNDLRHNRGRAYPLLPEWFKNLNFPIYPIFFANTYFTSDAKKVAKDNYIILRNEQQIVEDIIRLNDKWFIENEDRTIRFNSTEFINYFNQICDKS